MPSADGTMTVQTSGHYYNGSFGAKSNSLKVYYRYKSSDGSYGSWTEMAVALSGNTYSATANVTGLDYQMGYVFQAYAEDALAAVYATEQSVRAQPVFEWDKDDFLFNVPVQVGGKLTAESIALSTKTVYVGGDLNTYYPVRIYTYNDVATPQYLFVKKHLGSESPAWTGNHASGTSSLVAGWMYRSMGWDGNGSYISTLYKHEPYAKLLGHVRLGKNAANSLVVWLRGGGANYYISSNLPITPTVYLTTTNISTEAYPDNVAPITAIENGGVLFSNTSFLLDRVYPINSIYISYSQTSPAALFGGTWTRINDKFLWAISSTAASSIGLTGGASTHTLTKDEMPAHSHDMPFSGNSSAYQSPYPYYVKSASAANDASGRGWRDNLGTFEIGGGQAHNNMPPYIQVAVWRRTA